MSPENSGPDREAATAARRVDAHQHFWSLRRGDYAWLTPSLPPLYRDFLPADLSPHLREADVRQTVLVQAAETVEETRWLLGLADETAFVAGVVGWIPMDSRDGVGALDALAAQRKFVGVRPMIQDVPDDAWMLRTELTPALRALV